MAKLKLTPEMQDKICKAIADGNYIETACQLSGISKETYYRWIKYAEGEEAPEWGGDKEIYCNFYDAIKKAESEAEAFFLSQIKRAAPRSWQAAAWYCERKMPDKYGQRQRMDLNVTGDIKITLDKELDDLAD